MVKRAVRFHPPNPDAPRRVAPANGRSEPPLLLGDAYRTGTYELVMHVDEYFAARKANLPQPLFLSKIPLRLRVTDASQRIHLPVTFGP